MKSLVYINGELIPEAEAKISIFDVGRLYGATFYESIRTFRHKFFKLDAHLERLEHSLRYVGLIDYVKMEKVREAAQVVLDANINFVSKDDDLWVCVEVTPGNTFPMPLLEDKIKKPTIIAYSSPIPYKEYVEYYYSGVTIITSIYKNVPPQCFEQRCKNRSRLTHFLSKIYAKHINPNAYAIMLDLDGFITEGTGANVFFVFNGIIYTPTTRNILNGISRQYVISLARELNIPVVEKDITLYEAYNASEAFLTTTSYCILPISKIDDKKIGEKYPGPYASKLLNAWSKNVGVDVIGQAKKFANLK